MTAPTILASALWRWNNFHLLCSNYGVCLSVTATNGSNQVNQREHNTIIAALRLLQQHKVKGFVNPEIEELELDGETPPMTADEMDTFCEVFNCRKLAASFSISYNGNRREVTIEPDGTGLSVYIEGCTTLTHEPGAVVTIDLEENGDPLVTVYDDAEKEDGQRFNMAGTLA